MQVAKTPQLAQCERIVIRTADGREFDLGRPDSVWFRVRVLIYRFMRWLNG